MKKITFLLVVLFLGALFCGNAAAQIYKYQDDSGQVFFTNDIGQVPGQYRDQVTDYYETPADGGYASNNYAYEDDDYDDNNANNSTEIENPQLEMRRQALENARGELDQIFNDLTARQQRLEERRLTIPVEDQEGLSAFNAEVTELNLAIEAYKQRSSQYEQDVRSFNQLLMDLNP